MTRAACVILCAAFAGCHHPEGERPYRLHGQVVAVVDGDTLDVVDAGARHRIRIAGIDAPERDQPAGLDARRALDSLAYGRIVDAQCSKVEVRREGGHRRDICNVFQGGRDLGLSLIAAGHAWHFKRFQADQGQGEREAYADAETQARAHHRGIWVAPGAVPPWQWRDSHASARRRNSR